MDSDKSQTLSHIPSMTMSLIYDTPIIICSTVNGR